MVRFAYATETELPPCPEGEERDPMDGECRPPSQFASFVGFDGVKHGPRGAADSDPDFEVGPDGDSYRTAESLQRLAEPDPDYKPGGPMYSPIAGGPMYSPIAPQIPKSSITPTRPTRSARVSGSVLEPPCVGIASVSGGGIVSGVIGTGRGAGWRLVTVDGKTVRVRTKGNVNCTRLATEPSMAEFVKTGRFPIDVNVSGRSKPPCLGTATATDGTFQSGKIQPGKNKAHGGWYKVTTEDGTVKRVRGIANVQCNA